MKKRGLFEKLLIAYAVFIVVLVGLTIVLVYVSSRISTITTDIYLVDYRKKEITDAMIQDLISIEETGKQYFLLRKESYRSIIDQKESDIFNAWERLRRDSLCYDDEERKVVDNGYDIWQGLVERLRSQMENLPENTTDIELLFQDNTKDLDTLLGFARYINGRAIKSLDG
ncbi:MAG TPA: hypothetical protein PLM29_15255, partial [Deltaproteobacteria bacterium]|nr:hypothetical protein [Deltaproteobacteria bacterium]